MRFTSLDTSNSSSATIRAERLIPPITNNAAITVIARTLKTPIKYVAIH